MAPGLSAIKGNKINKRFIKRIAFFDLFKRSVILEIGLKN
jgi:hypothetical protein